MVGVRVGYRVPALYMYRLPHFTRTPATYSRIFDSRIFTRIRPALLHFTNTRSKRDPRAKQGLGGVSKNQSASGREMSIFLPSGLECRLGFPVHCLQSNGVIIHMTSRTLHNAATSWITCYSTFPAGMGKMRVAKLRVGILRVEASK